MPPGTGGVPDGPERRHVQRGSHAAFARAVSEMSRGKSPGLSGDNLRRSERRRTVACVAVATKSVAASSTAAGTATRASLDSSPSGWKTAWQSSQLWANSSMAAWVASKAAGSPSSPNWRIPAFTAAGGVHASERRTPATSRPRWAAPSRPALAMLPWAITARTAGVTGHVGGCLLRPILLALFDVPLQLGVDQRDRFHQFGQARRPFPTSTRPRSPSVDAAAAFTAATPSFAAA